VSQFPQSGTLSLQLSKCVPAATFFAIIPRPTISSSPSNWNLLCAFPLAPQIWLTSMRIYKSYLHMHTYICFTALWTFSRITWVSWYQNQSGFYWSKRQWVAVASARLHAWLCVCTPYLATEHVDGLWRKATPPQSGQCEKSRVVPVSVQHHRKWLDN